MEETTEQQEQETKVVQFNRIGKKKPQEKKLINWSASNEEEAIYNRAVNVIDAHTDNMIDVLASYMKENEIIDPEKLSVGEFKDMVLVKEALKSLMFRVLGFEHELQTIVENFMEIPLPTEEELNGEENNE
jgi:hypothetical protein